MNKVDLAILVIIGIFMFIGYKKGLLGTVLNLLQYVIILLLSVKFSPLVSNFLIKTFKLDGIILDWIYNNPKIISEVLTAISDSILQNIVGRIISVISFIILFIILKIIFTLIICLLNKIASLPILNEINKIGGVAAGAIEGVIIVYIAIILINWLPIAQLGPVKSMVSESKVGSTVNKFVPTAATEIIELSGIKKRI